jgi:hypothetical protein
LWLASKVLGSHVAGGPFGKPLTDYTVAELDFVLEMGALDEPNRFTFTRGGRDPTRAAVDMHTAWMRVRTGAALTRQFDGEGITAANERLAAYRRRGGYQGGLKPGVTRGGKPVPPDA